MSDEFYNEFYNAFTTSALASTSNPKNVSSISKKLNVDNAYGNCQKPPKLMNINYNRWAPRFIN
ncbi:hypothetical protein Hanom_Chr09g00789821 [Helianthus anomalus]